MYCRNCSTELSPEAIACTNCGVPPMKGKNYCYNCKSETHQEAIICVNCGVSLKNTINLDKTRLITTWSKYSYTNYILIILLSLMSFATIKCGPTKVHSVSGLNLAVSKDYTYKKQTYGWYGTAEFNRTKTIFAPDICAFYILIIFCLIFLLTSKTNKFKIARNLTIVCLCLLVEWFVVTSIRLSKYDAGVFEISFGAGFWLTAIVTILTLGLLSYYIKNIQSLDELE